MTRMVAELAQRVFPDDAAQQMAIMRHALRVAHDADLSRPPPTLTQEVQRRVRELCGYDPYLEIKERCTAVALARFDDLRARVRASADPFQTAVRLAAAGNILDAGLVARIDGAAIDTAVVDALDAPLNLDEIVALQDAVATAEHILYLADNAGELVIDRLLLEQLPCERVTLVVKGGPILNDATMAEIATSGIDPALAVIDNGSDAPGTVIDDCSNDLRRRFAAADLVISKGQGNFETLAGCGRRVFCIFKVKCAEVAREAGEPLGRIVARFWGP